MINTLNRCMSQIHRNKDSSTPLDSTLALTEKLNLFLHLYCMLRTFDLHEIGRIRLFENILAVQFGHSGVFIRLAAELFIARSQFLFPGVLGNASFV